MSLLTVENLNTRFFTEGGEVSAVRDVSFHLEKGEVLGIVGESGSGKSVTMLSVLGLLSDNGRVTSGQILFDGKDISSAGLSKAEAKKHDRMMQSIRGNEIGMIFQDPMTFLNPVLKIGTQMVEPIMLHMKLSRKEAEARAVELMRLVGIPSPESRLQQYPFEFSGGMRQRVIIAIALSCNPKLIIADEPTTALDVTIQAQVLELIQDIQKKLDSSVIMITHDLGVVASMCHRIIIMYGGMVVEEGTDENIFYEARHPYTWGLLASITNPDSDEREPLIPIPGSPPDLLTPPKGCPFVDRCSHAMAICKERIPPYTQISEKHRCACWLEQQKAQMGGER